MVSSIVPSGGVGVLLSWVGGWLSATTYDLGPATPSKVDTEDDVSGVVCLCVLLRGRGELARAC